MGHLENPWHQTAERTDTKDFITEMHYEMNSLSPLEKLRSQIDQLKTHFPNQPQEILLLKKNSLSFIFEYLDSAKDIQGLRFCYQHLKNDAEFQFLKYRRHDFFDKKATYPKTWQLIANYILQKIETFYAGQQLNLQHPNTRSHYQFLARAISVILGNQKLSSLMEVNLHFIDYINQHPQFECVWQRYQTIKENKNTEIGIKQLPFILILQNVFNLAESDMNNNFLTPLYYIAAIYFDEKLKNPTDDNNRLMKHNAYPTIIKCINQADNFDELSTIMNELNCDVFTFLSEDNATWQKILTAAYKKEATFANQYHCANVTTL